MGFEILPYQENDNQKLDIYQITGDHLWNPKAFKETSEENLLGVSPEEQILNSNALESQQRVSEKVPSPYDPSDFDIECIGQIPNVEFNVAFFESCVLNSQTQDQQDNVPQEKQ